MFCEDSDCLLPPGVAACEHILGRPAVWRVPDVVAENLHPARAHAVHVRHCRRRAHGLVRSQEQQVIIAPCVFQMLFILCLQEQTSTLADRMQRSSGNKAKGPCFRNQQGEFDS